MTFIDTSALYALADRGDPNHAAARQCFAELLARGDAIVTHNYVVLESIALTQRRLGLQAALRVGTDARKFRIEWITQRRHDDALAALRRRSSRAISLVDQISFLLMEELDIRRAFAFDDDFAHAGFQLIGRSD